MEPLSAQAGVIMLYKLPLFVAKVPHRISGIKLRLSLTTLSTRKCMLISNMQILQRRVSITAFAWQALPISLLRRRYAIYLRRAAKPAL